MSTKKKPQGTLSVVDKAVGLSPAKVDKLAAEYTELTATISAAQAKADKVKATLAEAVENQGIPEHGMSVEDSKRLTLEGKIYAVISTKVDPQTTVTPESCAILPKAIQNRIIVQVPKVDTEAFKKEVVAGNIKPSDLKKIQVVTRVGHSRLVIKPKV